MNRVLCLTGSIQIMWTKTSKPVLQRARTSAAARPAATTAPRSQPVLQSRRVPQQLSFEFRRA